MHHDAQKLTTTGRPRRWARSTSGWPSTRLGRRNGSAAPPPLTVRRSPLGDRDRNPAVATPPATATTAATMTIHRAGRRPRGRAGGVAVGGVPEGSGSSGFDPSGFDWTGSALTSYRVYEYRRSGDRRP